MQHIICIVIYNLRMHYLGDIIEESLRDKSVLKDVKVISTGIEKVTVQHKTPWLTQWTLHTIEVMEEEAPTLAERLSHALEPNYWYIDYKNNTSHYIIFPRKVFKVNRLQPKEYLPAVRHGVGLNIPSCQLDFSPEIKQWERPE